MSNYLIHYGVKGQEWGERKYQNKDGSLTSAGKIHYREMYGNTKIYSESARKAATASLDRTGAKKENPNKPSTVAKNNVGTTPATNKSGKVETDLSKYKNQDGTYTEEGKAKLKEAAMAVIRGNYGNGQARKDALGENYADIQKEVNSILKTGKMTDENDTSASTEEKKTAKKKSSKSKEEKKTEETKKEDDKSEEKKDDNKERITDQAKLEELANEVISGRLGTGQDRKEALGVNYEAVQALVNKKMKKSSKTSNTEKLTREFVENHNKNQSKAKAEKLTREFIEEHNKKVKHSNETEYLIHHGIIGQKWGVRRYRNEDGTLTEAGKSRYGSYSKDDIRSMKAKDKQVRRTRKIEKKYKRALSDDELNRSVERLERESRLSELTDKNLNPGKKATSDFIRQNGGKALAAVAVPATIYVGAKAVDKYAPGAGDYINKYAMFKVKK